MDEVDDLQSRYIAEMRTLQSQLIPWWKELTGVSELNEAVPEKIAVRWPFGFSGHPRVVAVFRKYFLELERHNDRELAAARERIFAQKKVQDADWGTDTEAEGIKLRRPVDVLIQDISDMAPDISKLVAGIVFVPVGLNPHNESV